MTRFIIGAASFGNNYGVSNNGEIVEEGNVKAIIERAFELGIKCFDTAPAYFPSESLLGKYLPKSPEVLVSSKIGAMQKLSFENIIKSVETSLTILNMNKIDCLYIHDPKVYSNPGLQVYVDALKELQQRELISKIGVSVYSTEEAYRNLEVIPEIDVIQIPENLCDRRILRSEFINEMNRSEKRVVIRSVYLQGLLLMEESQIPNSLSLARKPVRTIAKIAKDFDLSPAQLCLAYLNYFKNIHGAIVGISDMRQLADLSSDYSHLPSDWIELIPVLPEVIADPRLWK